MDISTLLKYIIKVDASNRVNILVKFNDDYSLLIEGSFRISDCRSEVVSSAAYAESDFNVDYLLGIKSLIEDQKILSANISELNGEIILKLENGARFESFFIEGDYESWELLNKEKSVYGSEIGHIVHY